MFRTTIGGMLAGLVVAAFTAPLAAAETDKGWHGEAMPKGLERASDQGEYVWRKDGSVMIYVPAGTFPMGSDEGAKDERPVNEVWLDGFYIDKYEVSWALYKKSGAPIDPNPASRLPQARGPDWGIHDEQPVLNVTWHDAMAYAVWAGKRLATEAEWEKTARGTDGRTYPWGSEPPSFERAVWKEHPTALISTAEVDCCAAGASPYGALNMAGNVYEWVLDSYESRYYQRAPKRNPVNLGDARYRSLRGGAFVLEAETLRSSYRYRLLPNDRTPYIGFRTALSGSEGGPDLKKLGEERR